MTRSDALIEARKRWGADGWAWVGADEHRKHVGTLSQDEEIEVSHAYGTTWEEAFAKADRFDLARRLENLRQFSTEDMIVILVERGYSVEANHDEH